MNKTPAQKKTPSKRKTPPAHLTPAQKAIFTEVLSVLEPSTPPQVAESIAIQIGIIREAREILAADTVIIVTQKGEKSAHPALEIAANATNTLDFLMGNWSAGE